MAHYATSLDLVPEPCCVLGTWLRPFCLGHHLLFRKLSFPFSMGPNAEASDEELLQAVAICAGQSYEWTLDLLLTGTYPDEFRRWKNQLRGPWYRRRRVDLADAGITFRAYLAKGQEFTLNPPLMRHNDAGGVSLSAPWESLLLATLTRGGLSRAEVLNGYLPAMWYQYHTLREMRQLENPYASEKSWRPAFWTLNDDMRYYPEKYEEWETSQAI